VIYRLLLHTDYQKDSFVGVVDVDLLDKAPVDDGDGDAGATLAVRC
jgi:hypothetical protein